jgi:hypothetical protein
MPFTVRSPPLAVNVDDVNIALPRASAGGEKFGTSIDVTLSAVLSLDRLKER